MASEFSNIFGSDDRDEELVVEKDKAEKDVQEIKVVNAGFPSLVDSAQALYIIPIGQKSIPRDQLREKAILNSYGSGSSYSRYSVVNNLLVYREGQEPFPVFDQKLLITEHDILRLNGRPFLVMQVISRDSNGDNLLNDEDSKSLAIYDFGKAEPELYESEGMSYQAYRMAESENYLFVEFTRELGPEAGKSSDNPSQTVLKKYVPGSGVSEIIPEKIIQKISNTIN